MAKVKQENAPTVQTTVKNAVEKTLTELVSGKQDSVIGLDSLENQLKEYNRSEILDVLRENKNPQFLFVVGRKGNSSRIIYSASGKIPKSAPKMVNHRKTRKQVTVEPVTQGSYIRVMIGGQSIAIPVSTELVTAA